LKSSSEAIHAELKFLPNWVSIIVNTY